MGGGCWQPSGTAKCLRNSGRRFEGYCSQQWFLDPILIPRGNPLASPESQQIFSCCLCFFPLWLIFSQKIIFPAIKSFLLGYQSRCLRSGFCHFLFTFFQVFLLKLKLNCRRFKFSGSTAIHSEEKHTGGSSPLTTHCSYQRLGAVWFS